MRVLVIWPLGWVMAMDPDDEISEHSGSVFLLPAMENECQLQIRDFNSLSEGMSSILWLEIHLEFIMGCPLIFPACMQWLDPVPTLSLDGKGSPQIDRFSDGKLIGSICCFSTFFILSKDLTSH